MSKISKTQAVKCARLGFKGLNYELPDIGGGSSVLFAEFTGEHGERTIGEKARIYFILEGTANFVVNSKKFKVKPFDVVSIEPNATYNFFPTSSVIKIILFSELLKLGKK